MHARLALLLGSLDLLLAQSADGPVINTPAAVPQCLPSLLQFHGGAPPYTISAIPGGQPGAAPLAELGSQSGDSMTWIANLPAGTSTTLQIRDSKGNINYSQQFTIQANNDDSCLKSGSTPSPTNPPNAGPATPPTTGPPSVSTGISSASPGTKPGNASAPGTQPNTTAPATAPNATAGTANSTAATGNSPNSTKGPSIFVPPTSNTTPVNNNNANQPANGAAAGAAAPGSAVCLHSLLAGLALAALAVVA